MSAQEHPSVYWSSLLFSDAMSTRHTPLRRCFWALESSLPTKSLSCALAQTHAISSCPYSMLGSVVRDSWDHLVVGSVSDCTRWLINVFPLPPPHDLVYLRCTLYWARSHTGCRRGRVSVGSGDLSITSLCNESHGSSECLGLWFQGTL